MDELNSNLGVLAEPLPAGDASCSTGWHQLFNLGGELYACPATRC